VGRSRRHARLGLAAAALLLAGSLAACGDDDGGDSVATPTTAPASSGGSATTAAPGAGTTTTASPGGGDTCTADKAGGELKMALATMTAGLDPTISTGSGTTGSIELSAFYGTLVQWDPTTREFTPAIAASLTPDATARTWTLKLRHDVTFGNGHKLDSAAVVYNIKRHQDPTSRSVLYGDVQAITSMDAPDPLTVVFHLREPWGSFPYVLGDIAGMIADPAVVDAKGRDAFNLDPTGAGAGPYELESYSPGQEIVMKAKPNWWGGQVCIQTLRFSDIPTEDATRDALELGEVDAAFFQAAKTIKEVQDKGFDNYVAVQHLGGLVMMYSKDASLPTADVRVRQAVAAAIDPTLIDQRVNDGTGLPGSTIIQADSPLSPGVPGPAYDPAKARQLVQEVKAGGWDGKIDLECATSQQEVAITLQGLFDAVGFSTNLRIVPPNQYITDVYVQPAYQITCGTAVVTEAAPSVRLTRWFGPDNRFTGFHDDRFDAALFQLKAASTVEQSKAALATLQTLWNELVPSAAYGAGREMVAWGTRVHGLTFSENTTALFTHAYLSK
jgi:peptide/nickel transport system substrate-binding protein